MEIRIAKESDRLNIIALYERSQLATGLPDPAFTPQSELGMRLYQRHAITRLVAIEAGQIVGHAMIEEPNSDHEAVWRIGLQDTGKPLIEMGAGFVDPTFFGQGIWTSLLRHRLQIIRARGAYPVTATWSRNEHVKRTFLANGGIAAGRQVTPFGDVDLFVFEFL